MSILELYKRAVAASNSLEGLLSVSKMQNYGRLDEKTAAMSMLIVLRDDDTTALLMKDLDTFVDGVAALKAEIAARQVAATTK